MTNNTPRFTSGLVVEIEGSDPEHRYGIITKVLVDKGEAHILLPDSGTKYPSSTVENLFNLKPVKFIDRKYIPWTSCYSHCLVVHNTGNFGKIQRHRGGRYFWNHLSNKGGCQDVTDDLGKFYLMADFTIAA